MKNKVIRGTVITGMACMMLSACGSKETNDTVEITENPQVLEENVTEKENEFVTEIIEAAVPKAEAVVLTAEDFTVTNLEYGTVMLTQYSGDAESVIIPSEVSGMQVTVIGKDAFVNHDELKSVVIPDTVVEIRDFAFMNCNNLDEVVMSKNIEKIGERVFLGPNYYEIELPDTLVELGEGAFSGCDFTSVVFPTSIENTGVYSFGSTNVENVVIPSNIRIVGDSVFEGCGKLKTVIIEEGAEVIEDDAFAQCELLESITIPVSVTEIIDNPFWWSENVTIYTPSGSYAEAWAAENGIPCIAQ